ncbi:MAG TPA: YbaB/EbfC family nucleoid-associated protein [Planctomycetota bacterium]|nr:YbaB/EbfC family nucleoid-associated protein [Planctomycetota bacterium]
MTGFNPQAMMQQARKMQEDMARVQKDLAQRMVEGAAGNGLVSVVMNGLQDVQAVRIRKDAVDPDDVEMLEDLVTVALKAALEKSRELQKAETAKVTGGLGGMGGLFG